MLDFRIEIDFLKTLNKPDGLIAGIDEAGRGALSGPVVAAAVILNKSNLNPKIKKDINDSKKLTIGKREKIFYSLRETNAIIGVGVVDNKIIDEINILNATFKAMEQALEELKPTADAVIIDGNKIPKNILLPSRAVVKGDAKSLSVAAASIIAKVTRDKIMDDLHKEYPEYSWNINKGYGTEKHYEMIEKHGISPYHRQSFRLSRKSVPADNQSLPLFRNLLQ